MQKQVNISYNISALKPVIDEKTFNLHYNGIYKQHVLMYNNAEGSIAYHKAGAHLHNLYFENLREYRPSNLPIGRVSQIIQQRYGNYNNFIKTGLDQISRLEGSGWIFMNSSGYINIIPNNRIVKDIALIIDFFEHAYLAKYGNDREQYFKDHLSIINWDVVNHRILENRKKDEKF